MMPKRDRATPGYVLIEVVVSLVVFSIGAVSIMRTFSSAAQARGLAQDFTIAGFLCQKVMSESRAAQGLTEGTETGSFGEEYPKFRWTRTVKLVVIELPPVPKGQREAERRRVSRRWGTLLERLREEEKAEQPEPIPFTVITVAVSWKRRGAGYSVSVETMVPVVGSELKLG